MPTRLTLTLPMLKLLSRMDLNSFADTSAGISRRKKKRKHLNLGTTLHYNKINYIDTVTTNEHFHTVAVDRNFVAIFILSKIKKKILQT